MGQQLDLTFTDGRQPAAWPAVQSAMTAAGHSVSMRLIDDQLALPDEAPPDTWRELRVALAGVPGMITIRRQVTATPTGPATVLSLVVWGNAPENLLSARQRLADAFAANAP